MYTKKEFNKRRYQKYADRIPYGPDINVLANGGSTWSNLAMKDWTGGTQEGQNMWNSLSKYSQNQITQDYMNSKNAFGISKKNNPFSKGNIGTTAVGIASAIAPVAGNLIGGGYSTGGVGEGIQNIGGTIGGAVGMVNPVAGAIVSGASALIGGLTNRAFGVKTDQEKLNRVNADTRMLQNFTSTAENFDEVQGPQAVSMDTGVYKGGWFSGDKAARQNAELKQKLLTAQDWANRSVGNNIANLASNQSSNLLSSWYANGGSIYIKPSRRGLFTEKAKRAGQGVQEYAAHVLANKEDYPTSTVRQANFARNASKWNALGGSIDSIDESSPIGYAFMNDYFGIKQQEANKDKMNQPLNTIFDKDFTKQFANGGTLSNLSEGDEIDLTPKQIEELKKQGYEIEDIS